MNFDYWLELNKDQIKKGLDHELNNYEVLLKYLKMAYDSGLEEGIRRTFWKSGEI